MRAIRGEPEDDHWVNWEMTLEAIIVSTDRYTWRLWLNKKGDVFRGHDHVKLDAVMKQLWWCTRRQILSEFGDSHASNDQLCLEMYSEAMIVWRGRLLRWENPYLTITETQFGRGKLAGGVRRFSATGDRLIQFWCTEIERYGGWAERWAVYIRETLG